MKQQQTRKAVKFQEWDGLCRTNMRIRVQFATESLVQCQIKVKPHYFITTLMLPPKKLPDPALLQMEGLASDPGAMTALKRRLAAGGVSWDDTMLDAQKLYSVLKAISRKRKPSVGGAAANRI